MAKHNFARAIVLALTPAIALVAFAEENSAPLPYKATGEVEEKDGWLFAKGAATVNMPLPAAAGNEKPIFRVRGKSGSDPAGVGFTLRDAAGVSTNYAVLPQN